MPATSTLVAGLTGNRDLDLIDALVDIARRVGVRHIAGDDRQRFLGRVDARHRGGQRLVDAHGSAVHAAMLTTGTPASLDDLSRLWIIWLAVVMTRALAE